MTFGRSFQVLGLLQGRLGQLLLAISSRRVAPQLLPLAPRCCHSGLVRARVWSLKAVTFSTMFITSASYSLARAASAVNSSTMSDLTFPHSSQTGISAHLRLGYPVLAGGARPPAAPPGGCAAGPFPALPVHLRRSGAAVGFGSWAAPATVAGRDAVGQAQDQLRVHHRVLHGLHGALEKAHDLGRRVDEIRHTAAGLRHLVQQVFVPIVPQAQGVDGNTRRPPSCLTARTLFVAKVWPSVRSSMRLMRSAERAFSALPIPGPSRRRWPYPHKSRMRSIFCFRPACR